MLAAPPNTDLRAAVIIPPSTCVVPAESLDSISTLLIPSSHSAIGVARVLGIKCTKLGLLASDQTKQATNTVQLAVTSMSEET